jgi:hypothetical protein
MSNSIIPVNEVKQMALAVANSGFFGYDTPEQALTLMLVAQAEGRHPASAAKEYHLIKGRPALKSDAMLARFQQAGGSVNWEERSAEKVCAKFSHPQGGELRICWTLEDAKRAGLANGDNWKKYPRQMLSARVISEGVRMVYPSVISGFYTPEEVQDFAPMEKPKPIIAKPIFKKDEESKQDEASPEPAIIESDIVKTETEALPLRDELWMKMESANITESQIFGFLEFKKIAVVNDHVSDLPIDIIERLVERFDSVVKFSNK